MRPETPKTFLINADGYHEHNRYFNQAEKIFDQLEKITLELEENIKDIALLFTGQELVFEEFCFNIGCQFFDFKKKIAEFTNKEGT